MRKGAWFGMAVKSPSMPGICTLVACDRGELALGADEVELEGVGHQAASAAMRSAFLITSSMPPTM